MFGNGTLDESPRPTITLTADAQVIHIVLRVAGLYGCRSN